MKKVLGVIFRIWCYICPFLLFAGGLSLIYLYGYLADMPYENLFWVCYGGFSIGFGISCLFPLIFDRYLPSNDEVK